MTILRNTLIKILAICIPACGILSCVVATPPPNTTPAEVESSELVGPTVEEMGAAIGTWGTSQRHVKAVPFSVGGTKLSKAEAKALERFAAEYKKHDGKPFLEIQGHADSSGSEDANQRISQQRADVVQKFLVDLGISADQMRAKGYGSKNLLCKDTEVSTWQKKCCNGLNRRVTIVESSP